MDKLATLMPTFRKLFDWGLGVTLPLLFIGGWQQYEITKGWLDWEFTVVGTVPMWQLLVATTVILADRLRRGEKPGSAPFQENEEKNEQSS